VHPRPNLVVLGSPWSRPPLGSDSHRALRGLSLTKDKLSRLVKRVLNNFKNALDVMHSVELPVYINELFVAVQKRLGRPSAGC
jgi:hypothetical protein